MIRLEMNVVHQMFFKEIQEAHVWKDRDSHEEINLMKGIEEKKREEETSS